MFFGARQKKQLFFKGSQTISVHDCGNQNRSDVFRALTKCFLCLNFTRTYPEHCDEREIENFTETNVKLQRNLTLKFNLSVVLQKLSELTCILVIESVIYNIQLDF